MFNELLENEISHSFNNVDLIETIPRELKLFNLKDGLHLNKKHGCKALAGIILKSLYAKLRPDACNTGGRKNSQNKDSRKNVNRNREVLNPIKRVVGALMEGLDVLTVLLSRS